MSWVWNARPMTVDGKLPVERFSNETRPTGKTVNKRGVCEGLQSVPKGKTSR